MARPRKIKKLAHQAALDRMADLIIRTKKPQPYAVSRSVLGRSASKSETDKLARDFCEFKDPLIAAACRRRAVTKSQASAGEQLEAMKREHADALRLAAIDPVKLALRDRPAVLHEYERQTAGLAAQRKRLEQADDPIAMAVRDADGF